jgi:hypothetical protein
MTCSSPTRMFVHKLSIETYTNDSASCKRLVYNSEYVTYQLTYDVRINRNDLVFRNTFEIRFDRCIAEGTLQESYPPFQVSIILINITDLDFSYLKKLTVIMVGRSFFCEETASE